MISFSLPGLVNLTKNQNQNHELNNEGCRCPLCQKINARDNLVLSIFQFTDLLSQQYHPIHHRQTYLDIIDEMIVWQKYNRKLRFCLPQLCIFFEGNPVHLITKNKQNSYIKIVRSKSKLNVFELQSFFLEGYLFHNPQITNIKRQKEQFKERTKQLTVVAAKYNKNVTILLTLEQLGNMFKSKYKYMRDGLIHLQTLVGAHHAAEFVINIDLVIMKYEHPNIYERAITQACIFTGEIKVTDSEFYNQKAQIQYENQLRSKDLRLYLTYLSLKIIFISGKLNPNIIKQSVFKWATVKGQDFLWDMRVKSLDKSTSYWQTSGMKALQIKLKKTMSMMQLTPENDKPVTEPLGLRAREMSQRLQQSTEEQWNEMKVIRSRLQKLQNQKKSLMQSQKQSLQNRSRTFRLRNVRKKQCMNQSMNFQ